MEKLESRASFGGRQEVWAPDAGTLGCAMRVAVYLPPAACSGQRCPVLYWLSGLTCSEQNFITKAGFQQYAARYGIIVVACDTSPRGPLVADDPAYDLGQGAGFYLNATQPPWSAHFRMEDYVVHELPEFMERHFPAINCRVVAGHSMGGHGALTLALRHPTRYASVSAFSPIVAPTQVPWGRKAFSAYLGEHPESWLSHDTVALIADATERLPLLVDQGEADEFLASQLRPELLEAACAAAGHPLTLRRHPGYDHSYYFIASFIGDHFAHHAEAFQNLGRL
ncbi:MAG: S-formylglutathione hydrolase [Betaproteobacteria bacterium]